MSKKTAIVTDSTAYIPQQLIDQYHIIVAPQILIWGDEMLQDGVDIQPTDYYTRLKTAKVMPSTSQVTPNTFHRIFSELLEQDYDILAVFLATTLSGTISSAAQAKEMLPGSNIEIIDSQTTAAFLPVCLIRCIILSMDIFFTDPNEIPLPPEEVRIKELRAEPWANGQKIHIYLEVDPSQKRPSAELILINPSGDPISSISIVESMTRKMEVNMHLRAKPESGQYFLLATLYFDQLKSDTNPDQPPEMDHLEVDNAKVSFLFEKST